MRTWHLWMRRCAPLALCLSVSPAAALAEPIERTPGGAFRTELRPQLEVVFPDASDYQRVLARAAELSAAMRRVSDEFARAVQSALREVNVLQGDRTPQQCPQAVAQSYAQAQLLGQEYLRIGRELQRHHDQVRELDRLGDTVALTPDDRSRVHKVLREYEALLGDYREMKATFHDRLTDELRFAGCDLGQRVVQGTPPPRQLPQERPRPQVAAGSGPPERGILFYVDNSRCRRGHRVLLDGQLLGEVEGAARAAFRATAGPHELCLLSMAPPTRLAAVGAGTRLRSPEPRDGGTRDAGAQADEGVQEISAGQRCGDPGTVRRSYLHDGWTIALRCE